MEHHRGWDEATKLFGKGEAEWVTPPHVYQQLSAVALDRDDRSAFERKAYLVATVRSDEDDDEDEEEVEDELDPQ